jgi:mevalonate kinase
LSIAPWGVDVTPGADADEPLARAFDALLALFDPRPTLHVKAEVGIPGGAGLGCSAALGVAILGALDEAASVSRTCEARALMSLAWERVFHGNPSGVDSAMSSCGGVAVFRRDEPLEPVALRAPLSLVVGHSGETSSTKTMVDSVARQHGKNPERIDKTFDAIAALVQNARVSLMAGDLVELGKLMDLNHALLNSLMLSTARLEELCAAARHAGALGAKLTGAGGGGCMIALVDDDVATRRVMDALEGEGASPFVVEVAS